VVWKHAFRNSLLPVLTLFANIFPYAIAGSVVVEVVFSIPGMGRLTLEAIYARNFPVVYTVVMLSALMTMIGYLVVDILYAFADPRITFKTAKR
jgi:peptide/nickel transport system permease protein